MCPSEQIGECLLGSPETVRQLKALHILSKQQENNTTGGLASLYSPLLPITVTLIIYVAINKYMYIILYICRCVYDMYVQHNITLRHVHCPMLYFIFKYILDVGPERYSLAFPIEPLI